MSIDPNLILNLYLDAQRDKELLATTTTNTYVVRASKLANSVPATHISYDSIVNRGFDSLYATPTHNKKVIYNNTRLDSIQCLLSETKSIITCYHKDATISQKKDDNPGVLYSSPHSLTIALCPNRAVVEKKLTGVMTGLNKDWRTGTITASTPNMHYEENIQQEFVPMVNTFLEAMHQGASSSLDLIDIDIQQSVDLEYLKVQHTIPFNTGNKLLSLMYIKMHKMFHNPRDRLAVLPQIISLLTSLFSSNDLSVSDEHMEGIFRSLTAWLENYQLVSTTAVNIEDKLIDTMRALDALFSKCWSANTLISQSDIYMTDFLEQMKKAYFSSSKVYEEIYERFVEEIDPVALLTRKRAYLVSDQVADTHRQNKYLPSTLLDGASYTLYDLSSNAVAPYTRHTMDDLLVTIILKEHDRELKIDLFSSLKLTMLRQKESSQFKISDMTMCILYKFYLICNHIHIYRLVGDTITMIDDNYKDVHDFVLPETEDGVKLPRWLDYNIIKNKYPQWLLMFEFITKFKIITRHYFGHTIKNGFINSVAFLYKKALFDMSSNMNIIDQYDMYIANHRAKIRPFTHNIEFSNTYKGLPQIEKGIPGTYYSHTFASCYSYKCWIYEELIDSAILFVYSVEHITNKSTADSPQAFVRTMSEYKTIIQGLLVPFMTDSTQRMMYSPNYHLHDMASIIAKDRQFAINTIPLFFHYPIISTLLHNMYDTFMTNSNNILTATARQYYIAITQLIIDDLKGSHAFDILTSRVRFDGTKQLLFERLKHFQHHTPLTFEAIADNYFSKINFTDIDGCTSINEFQTQIKNVQGEKLKQDMIPQNTELYHIYSKFVTYNFLLQEGNNGTDVMTSYAQMVAKALMGSK